MRFKAFTYSMKKHVLTIVLCMGISSCKTAGENFSKPPLEDFKIGATTLREVRSAYGKPFETSKITKHDKFVDVLNYYFTEYDDLFRGKHRASKFLSFYFSDSTLCGFIYGSSFEDDGVGFDDSKINLIQKGKTTNSEVEKLLGKPNGKMMFPNLDKEASEKDKEWVYFQYKFLDLNNRATKKLEILFDSNSVVKKVTFHLNQKDID
jgi:hypothetical protein